MASSKEEKEMPPIDHIVKLAEAREIEWWAKLQKESAETSKQIEFFNKERARLRLEGQKLVAEIKTEINSTNPTPSK